MLAASRYCGASDDRSRAAGSNPVKPLSKLPGPNSEDPALRLAESCAGAVSVVTFHTSCFCLPLKTEKAHL